MQDSGQPTEVYAISEKGGDVILTVKLDGIKMDDWEDIALYEDDGKHYIYIADTGNNYKPANREKLSVYRFEEPEVRGRRKSRRKIEIPKRKIERYTFNYGSKFRYPNFPDCEAFVVDPYNGDMFFFTKTKKDSEVYVYPGYKQRPNRNFRLERLGKLPIRYATGADMTPDGDYLAINNYNRYGEGGYGLSRGRGGWKDKFRSNPKPCEFGLASQKQREALGASAKGWYTTSEGKNQDVFFYAFN